MSDPTSSSSSITVAESPDKDLEAQKNSSMKASHWQLVIDQTHVTKEVLEWKYRGLGTEEDPYVVEYIENDKRNPMLWSDSKKWTITIIVAFATLAVSFTSSAFTGGIDGILAQFSISSEVAILGISLFVLGFALGPLIWAPMSELYGRQVLFFGTYAMLTAFNAGAAGSQNIQTLLLMRFFAGAFGSSPLTNAGGVIADMFPSTQRGLAMSIFASAPFLGPTLGPIAGGFLGETEGWRWVEGLTAIFTGTLWIIGAFLIPETYSPVILSKRAKKLSKITGKVYKSRMEVDHGAKTVSQAFKTSLLRPWVLLFREPIVLMLSIYMAIIYGTLYMLFSAFPIVFQEGRGWSPGIGGLGFIGVMIGMITAVIYSIWDNKRYAKISEKYDGKAPPESRLPPSLVGCVSLPIGMFWFAWTNSPSIHWSVCIIGTAPFGFGMVLVFLSIMNYLIDSYVIYAASVLAANSVLRSLFGAIFPLFTTYMYQNLGIHWASSIPAFLALACVPFPFLFYKFGESIRLRCKFAAEAAEALEKMRSNGERTDIDGEGDDVQDEGDEEKRVTGGVFDGKKRGRRELDDEEKRDGGNRQDRELDFDDEDKDRITRAKKE